MTKRSKITQIESEHGCLTWFHDKGYGYHNAPPITYEGDYWTEFRRRDDSPMGEKLTKARVAYVRQFYTFRGIDIGIGGGRYVIESSWDGFDVNEHAIAWLKERHRFADPYDGVDAITCWDSLEHIPDFRMLLDAVNDWVFVSIPIFTDLPHVLGSRHYKPGEHIWYMTHEGFVCVMRESGFKLIDYNDMETRLGRDGIGTYAFKRIWDS